MVELPDYESETVIAEKKEFSKLYIPPKHYVQRLKRHQDAVMALHSPDKIEGSILFSASADE